MPRHRGARHTDYRRVLVGGKKQMTPEVNITTELQNTFPLVGEENKKRCEKRVYLSLGTKKAADDQGKRVRGGD